MTRQYLLDTLEDSPTITQPANIFDTLHIPLWLPSKGNKGLHLGGNLAHDGEYGGYNGIR